MKRKILGLIIGFLFIGINGFAADGDLIVNGNVGIGTTAPASKLEVWRTSAGAITSVLDLVNNSSNSNTGVKIDFTPNINVPLADITALRTDTGGSGVTDFIFNLWNGSSMQERLRIVGGSGNVGIGTTAPGGYRLYVAGSAYSTGGWQSSDLRFKENIMPIKSPLSKILNIEGISFDWKTDEFKDKGFPEGRHYGVVAQEVERVLPEVVKDGPGGEKSVSYTEIVPVLIEAIKEQQKEIERLKTEVTELKTRN